MAMNRFTAAEVAATVTKLNGMETGSFYRRQLAAIGEAHAAGQKTMNLFYGNHGYMRDLGIITSPSKGTGRYKISAFGKLVLNEFGYDPA
ncbi:MAG: hypothetical protein WAX89_07320 [Alphaproteobacteria bacterium]